MGASLLGITTDGTIGGYFETDLAANDQTETASNPVVLITDLAENVPLLTDKNGIVHPAAITDPNLVNPWGVTESGGSPFWVADNNAGVSTLYNVPGFSAPISINPLVVSIPSPSDPLHATGAPTGAVFNVALASKEFPIAGVDKNGNAIAAPAIFLFATEDGTIVGWNPTVNPVGFDPAKAGTYGIIAVDNSTNPSAAAGAVYKGLAIATDSNGTTLLYATNFRAGTVEVYDSTFTPVTPSSNAFTDPKLKSGYAPFNIVAASGELFVTYAVQDATKHDDVAGHAHGIVDTFDLSGNMIARFTQHGHLNSPWGLVQAPASFGQFAGAILIGNFGDGRINAFDPGTGAFLATVVNPKGQEILIDGLWSLRVGNGRAGGDTNTIYFTAGPNGEKDGLFGSLTPVALGSPCGPTCI
jgi:uncharacterized protein (TIGR03118 family)